jgi:DNA primase
MIAGQDILASQYLGNDSRGALRGVRFLFSVACRIYGESSMPGVDFAAVRSAISIAQVLDLVGFVVQSRTCNQVRGACPLHRSSSTRSRSFSVNLDTNRFQCFKCRKTGGQLELWAAYREITVYEAAIELCERFCIEVPWVRRW